MRKIAFIVLVGIVLSTGCSIEDGKNSRKEITDQKFREWSGEAEGTIKRDIKNLSYGISRVNSGDYETFGKMGGILKDDATRLLFEVRRMKVSEKYQKLFDFQILWLENLKKAGEVIELGAPIRDPNTLTDSMVYLVKAQTYREFVNTELSIINK